MHIGEMAKQFGLNPRTIRYYEIIGVLPKAARTESGYRIYSHEAAERLGFIIRAKALGFTLEEVRQILLLHDEGVAPCVHTKDFIRRKLGEIDEKVAALLSLKKTLSQALKAGFREHSAAFCPIIEGAGMKRLALRRATRDRE